jgi:ABC-type multidrug transport system fused ATPase/permease subunit
MHNLITERVVRANILFFDSNPIGRIMTHFSKDMSVVDAMLAFLIPIISYGFFRAVSVSVALCWVNYWTIVPLLFSIGYLTYILK